MRSAIHTLSFDGLDTLKEIIEGLQTYDSDNIMISCLSPKTISALLDAALYGIERQIATRETEHRDLRAVSEDDDGIW